MGHLFHVHGISDTSNEGNFGSKLFYWTETALEPVEEGVVSIYRGVFDFKTGEHGAEDIIDNYYSTAAWLVSDGDIAAIPVPTAVWLFASGLVGLFATARQKHQS